MVTRASLLRLALVVGIAGTWLATVTTQSARSATAMATAATTFLEGLTPEQRQQASFPMDSEERLRWNFIPTNMFPRKGVPIKEMTEPQRQLAHNLLKAGLSSRGYLTATSIMQLETILKAIESANGGGQNRDPELYFFTIFGTPSAKGAWGWRVEGHHVSLHFTVANGAAVASSPAFFGTNPAEVRDGEKKGLRILGDLEDAGRALLMALDDTQRGTAVFDKVAPKEIITNNAVQVDPLSPAGVSAASMTPAQRELLMKLIQTYTSQMADDTAAARLSKLKQAGLEKIAFAWAGDAERGARHYYRVQGPTFLVEFDNTQNNGNHVHAVWRDFQGDFGRDLLRDHVKMSPH